MTALQTKSWFEKYGTAMTIIVSVGLTIGGWLYTNRIDREHELRNIKNTYISNAYKDISFYTTLISYKLATKEDFIKFERALKDIQLYGSLEEIKLTQNFILNNYAKKSLHPYNYDTLLNQMRNSLRNEFGLEKVEGGTYWIMDTIVYNGR